MQKMAETKGMVVGNSKLRVYAGFELMMFSESRLIINGAARLRNEKKSGEQN
jgi:hypothetical protein